MKLLPRRCLFLVCCMAVLPLALSQSGDIPSAQQGGDVRLPNGKMQRDEILKEEHANNLKDAAHLVELAEALKADLEKTDPMMLSLATLKKTDEIEKLVRKIRDRLHH